jgi:hypothetical protein
MGQFKIIWKKYQISQCMIINENGHCIEILSDVPGKSNGGRVWLFYKLKNYLSCDCNLKLIIWVNPEDVTAERGTIAPLCLLRIIPSLPILGSHFLPPKDNLHQEDGLIRLHSRAGNSLIPEAAAETSQTLCVAPITHLQDNQEIAIMSVGSKEIEACRILLASSSPRNRRTSRPNCVHSLIR